MLLFFFDSKIFFRKSTQIEVYSCTFFFEDTPRIEIHLKRLVAIKSLKTPAFSFHTGFTSQPEIPNLLRKRTIKGIVFFGHLIISIFNFSRKFTFCFVVHCDMIIIEMKSNLQIKELRSFAKVF